MFRAALRDLLVWISSHSCDQVWRPVSVHIARGQRGYGPARNWRGDWQTQDAVRTAQHHPDHGTITGTIGYGYVQVAILIEIRGNLVLPIAPTRP